MTMTNLQTNEIRRYQNSYGLICEVCDTVGSLEARMAYSINDLKYCIWRWCPDLREELARGLWHDLA